MSNQIVEMIERALDAKLVPFLEGSPGVGKTQTVRSVADDFNLKLIDVRLSTLDPTDIAGLPSKVQVETLNGMNTDRIAHIPSKLFPLEGDALPVKLDEHGQPLMRKQRDNKGNVLKDGKGNPLMEPDTYDGWLVVFEELPSCLPAMQAAAYKVLLEREVGEAKLHPAVEMIATGNRIKDKAVTMPMSTALRTRLCFIEVDTDNVEWLKWAYANNIDSRICTYLQWKPDLLDAFDPNIKQLNCPVPRTWEFASRILDQDRSKGTSIDETTYRLLQGVIGAAAFEFRNFLNFFSALPSIAAILKDPANADMPSEPGHQYALTSVLSEEMAKMGANVSDLVTYTERMQPELQAITFMDGIRKNRKLLPHPAIVKWTSANKDMINASI